MNSSKVGLITLFVIIYFSSIAQVTIDGHAYGENNEPLIGASVFFSAYDHGTVTDEKGFFEFQTSTFKKGSIIISFVGYSSDTLFILEAGHYDVTLRQGSQISEVTISSQAVGTGLKDAVQKIETINAIELTKAACCDLAGCFNTQGSVQVNTTNVITNSKELRLLGLSGVYNQILLDGLPLFMGNSLTFGISHYPGTLIQEISIAKGTSSVLQGYDAISGQINVTTRKFNETPAFFLNGYINNFGEKQLNYSQGYEIAENFRGTTNFHAVLPAGQMDQNEDGFLDMPLIKRAAVYQTFEYGDVNQVGYSNQFMVNFITEQRVGGEFDFNPDLHKGQNQVYGHFIDLDQFNLSTKQFYRWNGRQGIGWYTSYQNHAQNSWFGLLNYRSNMDNLNSRIQFETMYGKEHLFKAGISYRYFQMDEVVAIEEDRTERSYAGNYMRTESVPGLFVENTINLLDSRLNLITGIRYDFHNEFGQFFTPRLLARYVGDNMMTYRVSAGKGYRTVNLLADYAQITGGSRNLFITERILPEQAYNLGASVHKKWIGGDWWIEGGIDFFYTYFINQVFPDFDTDPLSVIVRNYSRSVESYSSQLDLKIEYAQWLEYKIIYNYLDVFNTIGNERISLPFLQKHRITQALSIRPIKKPWYIDLNVHYNGIQRLPDNPPSLPEVFRTDKFSIPYWNLNFQYTFKYKKWEFYAGVENILGFMQFNAIRSADDPFGPYFDISSVWGPMRGREYYFGFRIALDKTAHVHSH